MLNSLALDIRQQCAQIGQHPATACHSVARCTCQGDSQLNACAGQRRGGIESLVVFIEPAGVFVRSRRDRAFPFTARLLRLGRHELPNQLQ